MEFDYYVFSAVMAYFAGSMAEPISCIYSEHDRNYHIIKKSPRASRVPQLGFLLGGVAVVIRR